MPPRLIVTRKAQRQLDDMFLRTVELSGSVMVATEYIDRVLQRLKRLPSAPYQGTVLEPKRRGLRLTSFEHGAAIAFYANKSVVRVVAIAFNGEQYRENL